MRLVVVLLVALGMLLVSCGQDPAVEPEPNGDAPNGETPAEPEDDDMLEGTLGGDAQLEGGCAWLDTDEGRFEVMYPEGYEIAFDPVRLLGPDGDTIAREGETLRVRGRVAGDVMSICQVGTIFQATEVGADS